MNVTTLLNELQTILNKSKKQPYLPFWGNIFSVLYKVNKISIEQKEDIFFYKIYPSGNVSFCYNKKAFAIEIPDITIFLEINELTDSLMNDRFLPVIENK